jgi:hypothetical protein
LTPPIPVPIIRFTPAIPNEFEQLVAKALEKDRDLRYQSVAEMRLVTLAFGFVKRPWESLGPKNNPSSASSPPIQAITLCRALCYRLMASKWLTPIG